MTWDKPHSYRVIHGMGMIWIEMTDQNCSRPMGKRNMSTSSQVIDNIDFEIIVHFPFHSDGHQVWKWRPR